MYHCYNVKHSSITRGWESGYVIPIRVDVISHSTELISQRLEQQLNKIWS